MWSVSRRASHARQCIESKVEKAGLAERRLSLCRMFWIVQFTEARPNQKWVADTYLWTAECWLYVAAVIDVFSRRIVNWPKNANRTAQLVTDALIMAKWRRGEPDGSGYLSPMEPENKVGLA